MTVQKQQLIKAAQQVRQNAYAPFSNYKVGAAVLTEDGKIFTGCNVENSSYPLCKCAETTALTTAVSAGGRKFKMLAVVTEDGGSPCGACRQVIWELCDDIPILIADQSGQFKETTSAALLPLAFRLKK